MRSPTGCWTCKLRKKKCDETKPTCSVCTSLGIDCGGYGTRPDWMDGGIKEKIMANKVREAVKETTSHKKRFAMQKRQLRLKSLEENRPNDPLPIVAGSRLIHYPNTLTLLNSTNKQHLPSLIDGPPQNLSPEQSSAYLKQNESTLLMHYLDSVFPLQFSFYNTSLEEQGRGWLLYLLLQTKPLYHAACSLAAYHRQTMYCLRYGAMKACFTIEALNLQYDIAMAEMRSIALFVSIEACISSTEMWRVHLDAAIALFPDIHKQLNDRTSNEILLPSFQAALSFFTSVISWYDIVSYTTTSGLRKSFNFDDQETEKNRSVHFDKVMGCENWVIFLIKDIAELDHWKNTSKSTEPLSMKYLVNRGNDIEARLRRGLGKVDATLVNHVSATSRSRTGNISVAKNNYDYIRACVTRIYCNASLVYLHVVMLGSYPNLPEIQHSVSQTMDAIKALPDLGLINSMLWPFFIAGCMSMERDEDFFTGLARFGEPGDSTYGVAKAMTIVEECWRLRKYESGMVDWRFAMKSLGLNILLV
ncbi:hypothetical protein B7463_g5417, partial [Scytalidium lignicola]